MGWGPGWEALGSPRGQVKDAYPHPCSCPALPPLPGVLPTLEALPHSPKHKEACTQYPGEEPRDRGGHCEDVVPTVRTRVLHW